MQGRIKYLDQRSAYSQITLNIQPVTSPPPPRPTWDPGDVVERAWDASLAVLQVMATAIISAVVFGWWLAPVLLGGFLWWRSGTGALGPLLLNLRRPVDTATGLSGPVSRTRGIVE